MLTNVRVSLGCSHNKNLIIKSLLRILNAGMTFLGLMVTWCLGFVEPWASLPSDSFSILCHVRNYFLEYWNFTEFSQRPYRGGSTKGYWYPLYCHGGGWAPVKTPHDRAPPNCRTRSVTHRTDVHVSSGSRCLSCAATCSWQQVGFNFKSNLQYSTETRCAVLHSGD